LAPIVLRYAGNVNPPERKIACDDCYEFWTTDTWCLCVRDCIECAREDDINKLGRCEEEACGECFCPHAEPNRKFCNKHVAKKAKVDNDQ
jgi:hypothetical protein